MTLSVYSKSFAPDLEMDWFYLVQVAKLVLVCRLVSLETDCHFHRNAVSASTEACLPCESIERSQYHVIFLISIVRRRKTCLRVLVFISRSFLNCNSWAYGNLNKWRSRDQSSVLQVKSLLNWHNTNLLCTFYMLLQPPRQFNTWSLPVLMLV